MQTQLKGKLTIEECYGKQVKTKPSIILVTKVQSTIVQFRSSLILPKGEEVTYRLQFQYSHEVLKLEGNILNITREQNHGFLYTFRLKEGTDQLNRLVNILHNLEKYKETIRINAFLKNSNKERSYIF
ncbi:hypothetical protein [Pontibacillus yanchengensis]|uniref:Uncharacterized protein n=1 Tax=Pontibacillus yanchengensis Y32 TaxID=1385514 RepID=A0A0A2TI68_9BACI|nr:hypothetical protein [Pontibacillus yanchengensis]KGP74153.1 hypothetical protein N782_17505 [Pontibacillus yanchengensis Y32]